MAAVVLVKNVAETTMAVSVCITTLYLHLLNFNRTQGRGDTVNMWKSVDEELAAVKAERDGYREELRCERLMIKNRLSVPAVGENVRLREALERIAADDMKCCPDIHTPQRIAAQALKKYNGK